MLWEPGSENDAGIRNSGETKIQFALPDVTEKDLESDIMT